MNPIPASRTNPVAAFTLIELLAVIVIGILLLGIGIAGYVEMRKSLGVGTAARHVADHLDLARQTAMTTQLRTRYLIDSANGRGAVVRELPGLRSSTGGLYWQWVLEWNPLPMGISFLGTNTAAGTLERLPSLSTQLAIVNDAKYGHDGTALMTNAWDSDNNRWVTSSNYVSAFSAATSYRTVEFNPEGRPSQSYTVTVARSGSEYAHIIIDGLTGKVRVDRH